MQSNQQSKMHNEIHMVLRDYHSGLYRDTDLLSAMQYIAAKYKGTELGGHLDLNSGERYPVDFKLGE